MKISDFNQRKELTMKNIIFKFGSTNTGDVQAVNNGDSILIPNGYGDGFYGVAVGNHNDFNCLNKNELYPSIQLSGETKIGGDDSALKITGNFTAYAYTPKKSNPLAEYSGINADSWVILIED